MLGQKNRRGFLWRNPVKAWWSFISYIRKTVSFLKLQYAIQIDNIVLKGFGPPMLTFLLISKTLCFRFSLHSYTSSNTRILSLAFGTLYTKTFFSQPFHDFVSLECKMDVALFNYFCHCFPVHRFYFDSPFLLVTLIRSDSSKAIRNTLAALVNNET